VVIMHVHKYEIRI